MGDIPASLSSGPTCPVVVSSAPLKEPHDLDHELEPKRDDLDLEETAAVVNREPTNHSQNSTIANSSSELFADHPQYYPEHELQASGTVVQQSSNPPHQYSPYLQYQPPRHGSYAVTGIQHRVPPSSILTEPSPPSLIHAHTTPPVAQQPQRYLTSLPVVGFHAPQALAQYANVNVATPAASLVHPQISVPIQEPSVHYYPGAYPHMYYNIFRQPYGTYHSTHQYPRYPYTNGYQISTSYSTQQRPNSGTPTGQLQASTVAPPQEAAAAWHAQQQYQQNPLYTANLFTAGSTAHLIHHNYSHQSPQQPWNPTNLITHVPQPQPRRHSHPAIQTSKRRGSTGYSAGGIYRLSQPTIAPQFPPLLVAGGTSGTNAISPIVRSQSFGENVRMTADPANTSSSTETVRKISISEYQTDVHLPGSSSCLLARGPPRKPRQSGHALWVGNLPSIITVVALKDFFSTNFTTEIESVFLISKSNCAFVNYKSEASVQEAMWNFHEKRFKGVRLVCRLRRNVASVGNTAYSTGEEKSGEELAAAKDPPGKKESMDGKVEEDEQTTAPESPNANAAVTHKEGQDEGDTPREETGQKHSRAQSGLGPQNDHDNYQQQNQYPREGQRDRIFIVKSLTVEDLNLSVKSGVWATQSHNEEHLNRAFETSENVYLIFSANKSGEYYGYAKMVSKIEDRNGNDNTTTATEIVRKKTSLTVSEGTCANEVRDYGAGDSTLANTLAYQHPQQQSSVCPVSASIPIPLLPKTIYTPPTDTAPAGRIIDDSARGTIFWEAIHDADQEEEGGEEQDAVGEVMAQHTWGRPFKIQWVSTNRIPFYRTRGLRNAWNANREVKIARDGTEVETGVGKKLLSMFGKVPAAGFAYGIPGEETRV